MIREFQGEYRWLSNFWPCRIVSKTGLVFPSVEHAYQACKCKDPEQMKRFMVGTAADAKRLGRQFKARYWGMVEGKEQLIVPEFEIRPDWLSVRVEVMRRLLEQKFAPGTELAAKLKATGEEELIEGNRWHDNYWGCCLCGRHDQFRGWTCVYSMNNRNATTNQLGRLLMIRRACLKGGD